MNNSFIDEPMLEAYIYETSQILEDLEQLIIASEKAGRFSQDPINEIFRFMHTIKGSSAMMMFNDISTLAHRLEDIFFVIREDMTTEYDFTALVDLVLESIDYFKIELMKIKEGETPDGDQDQLITSLNVYLNNLKDEDTPKQITNKNTDQKYYIRPDKKENNVSYYKALIRFKKDSEMENIRSYTIVHNITNMVEQVLYKPKKIIEDDSSLDQIKKDGFLLMIKTTTSKDQIKDYLENTIFLESLEFTTVDKNTYDAFELEISDHVDMSSDVQIPETSKKYQEKEISSNRIEHQGTAKKSIISVNVDKLDKLMDMVGEMVIAEAMVTQNPEVNALEIESFEKASRQLHKITGDLQDMVMAIRMVPLSTTFMKMHRIVRDMTHKLGKKVVLDVYGEETEVDKNIIEKIADPLMHIIRNAIDHGIEESSIRLKHGKKPEGTIHLEAKNSGSDVLIIIKDDGKGLNKEALYNKAVSNGLINRSYDDMSERELYELILKPGFSTKDTVSEYSGRGVGMDVVAKNIESIGGTVLVESTLFLGTTIILKIPLTLAIIEGMNIRVGSSRFTIPIVAIKESFRAKSTEIFKDTEGEEMIMVRGLCYPIIRLHQFYEINDAISNMEEGILLMVEEDGKACCLFADELIGQQQVVIKTLPDYIRKYKQIQGLGGCTLLGDGNISLILDVGAFDLSNVNEKIYKQKR